MNEHVQTAEVLAHCTAIKSNRRVTTAQSDVLIKYAMWRVARVAACVGELTLRA